MFAAVLVAAVSAIFATANGGVLLWGSQSIQIPSLKSFNNEDFDLLKAYLRNPKVLLFHGESNGISGKLQELLKNKYTAYIPNVDLILNDVIELSGTPEENFATIQQTLVKNEGENILALIISPNHRPKREAEDVTEIATTTEPEFYEETDGGPVLYNAHGKAMIYSSKTPTIKTNSSIFHLNEATIATTDRKNDVLVKLSTSIRVSEGKITLRFRFNWNRDYWTLSTVEFLDVDNKIYNLTARDDITALRSFSYHCSGQTVFANHHEGIELKMFDFQVQPDTNEGRFSDAYDCVNFTTAPIWSGLFVTSILITVLGIGISALGSIKTMDKFDTSKTKQLVVTVSE